MFVFDKLSVAADGVCKAEHNPILATIERLMCEVEFFWEVLCLKEGAFDYV